MASGLQTWVCEYASEPWWKKIACASAPRQVVKTAFRPAGSVTWTTKKAGSIAFRCGWP